MRKLLLLTLIVVLSACSVGTGSELSRNREKWEVSDINNYRFSLHVGCFCAFMDKMPLSIEVRNDQVVSISYANGEGVASDDPDLGFFTKFTTIDQIFAELESGETSKADSVTMTFDPTYGFPAEVQVDRIKLAADDEFSLSISNFEILQ
jgi:hypothetical protein